MEMLEPNRHVAHLLGAAAEEVAIAATAISDEVAYAGKGSKSGRKRKERYVNPLPWSTKNHSDDYLLAEIVLHCVGLVVIVILAIVTYSRNRLG